MERIRQRIRQQEQEKFDKEVDDECEQIKLEMDSIKLSVEPDDVEITSPEHGFWEHEVFNESPFEVVVRVRATSSYLFAVSNNTFRIPTGQVFKFRITRYPHEIRSHHIKLDVTRFAETFKHRSLHDYFVGPYPHKTFIIRYHGAPRYWQDALELNEWCAEKELTDRLDQEMKRTSREWKSSFEETDKEGTTTNSERHEADEKGREAGVNMANVLLMAVQDLQDENPSGSDSIGEDLDYEDMVDVNGQLMIDPNVSE